MRARGIAARRAAPAAGRAGRLHLAGSVLLACCVLVAGCARPAGAPSGAAHVAPSSSAAAAGEADEWSYHGETGPEHWSELRADFAPCRAGREQSPIDLRAARRVVGEPLEQLAGRGLLTHEERLHVLDLVDNGHTIQVIDPGLSAIDLDGEHYELVQYHFHAPSEHTIDGRRSPLEVHFVHRSASGRLAVLAVLVEAGPHSTVAEPIVAGLPSGPGDARHIEGLDIDIHDLPMLHGGYYRYRGSLTTPPCSEGVEWVVSARHGRISAEQIAAFEAHLHDNHRPVQPTGERAVVLVDVP